MAAFLQKGGAWTGGKIGWDYGNKSYFISLAFSFWKKIELSQSIEAVLSL